MKKNLFLLFSVYFFVIQPIIVGILWGQANFYRLGAVNFVAIILIGIGYNTLQGGSEKSQDHEKHPAQEAKMPSHEHVHIPVKSHQKSSEFTLPALFSFAVGIIIFFMFQYKNTTPEVMLFIALAIGFIAFFLLTRIFKHQGSKRFWKLWGTKVYILLLIVSLIWIGFSYSKVRKEFNASLTDYIAQNLLGEERIPTDGYVFTGEGTVLGSGLGSTTSDGEVSSDALAVITANSGIQNETGTVLGSSTNSTTNEQSTTTNTIATTQGNQKLMDAIIYLLKKYDIPLVTTQNVRFTYVSTNNPYYNEWRTAYANKLIGSTTNPSKYIICDSYIVMKGLLEKWGVSYTAKTALTNFWAEAVRRDALNGCEKGKIVTDVNL